MYKYIVFSALALPLYGVWLMERGAFGWSVGRQGYPNGATQMFAIYAALVAGIGALVASVAGRLWPVAADRRGAPDYRVFSRRLILVLGGCLLLLLFGFGGIQVWLGLKHKGEFRTGLGLFGAPAFMLTKYVIPAVLAYGAFLFRRASKNLPNRLYLAMSLLMAFLCGAVWGYKATPVSVLLPAILILTWRTSLWRTAVVAGAAAGSMFVLYFVFDFDAGHASSSALEFLWQRLTVLQGDVAWEIWDQYKSRGWFPPYSRTLLPILGNRMFTALTGLSAANFDLWSGYQYGFLITSLAGVPLHVIEAGHNVTGTAFSEGVIAGGRYGAVAFGVLGGLITGGLYVAIDRALKQGRGAAASVLTTYFCWAVFPWLLSGGLLTMLHIAVFVGLFGGYCLIWLLRWQPGARVPPAAGHRLRHLGLAPRGLSPGRVGWRRGNKNLRARRCTSRRIGRKSP